MQQFYSWGHEITVNTLVKHFLIILLQYNFFYKKRTIILVLRQIGILGKLFLLFLQLFFN